MIDLYYWTTPNGHKITIFLEESELAYKLHPINIGKNEQFQSDFLTIAPNNKIPAIVDHNPEDNGKPISVFESGAILLYLAQKTQQFLPLDLRKRVTAMEWLFWQVGGLGPMLGQNNHFANMAKEKIPYAIERFTAETARLFSVLEKQLSGKEFIAEEYSIADMACFPWVKIYERLSQNLNDYPNIATWLKRVNNRPAVQRAYALVEKVN